MEFAHTEIPEKIIPKQHVITFTFLQEELDELTRYIGDTSAKGVTINHNIYTKLIAIYGGNAAWLRYRGPEHEAE